MGFKVGYTFNDRDNFTLNDGVSADGLTFNAQVFETKIEATMSAYELMSRWTLPTGFEIIKVDAPINYKFIDRKAQRIEVN